MLTQHHDEEHQNTPAMQPDSLNEQQNPQPEETPATPEPEPIQWEDIHFPGKEFCLLTDNREIALKATPFSEERVLSVITLDNYEVMAQALSDKFNEAKEKLAELETEWSQTEDVLKLAGKLFRMQDYLKQINAIGDFTPLLAAVAKMEQAIKDQYATNYKVKAEIVGRAEALKD